MTDTPAATSETRTVEPAEWVGAVAAARDEGFAYFDWLTAVDRLYDEAEPGFDVTLVNPSVEDGAAGRLALVC